MLPELDNYDCEEAFKYVGVPDVVPPGSKVAADGFARDDVKRLFALDIGENDGPEFLAAGELNDGRYFVLDAWRDYTGWDCQAGGTAHVADTEANAIRFGLSEQQRERLGLKLTE